MTNQNVAALIERLRNGVSPAMATPIIPGSYQVNTVEVAPLVDFLIGAGAVGLFVGGTTGEGILFEADERRKLHEAAIAAAAGRVPVLVHVGAQRIDEARSLAQHASAAGASAIVSLTPYFYGLPDAALLRYFQAVAAAAPEMPFFVYDIPQFSVNGISPELLGQMIASIPNMAGIKCSRPDVQFVRRHADVIPSDRILLVGNESAALGLLALGADGLISGLSTALPEPFVGLTNAYAAGDMAGAAAWQRTINRLLALLPAGARIGGIKAILNQRGLNVGLPTPTLPATDEPLWERAQSILAEHGA